MSARNVTAQNVPPNWDVRRLKSICSLAYGDSLPDAERSNGEIPVYGSNGKIGTHFVSNTDGPSIVIGRKGSFGKVHFSEQPAFAIDTTYFVDRNYTHADLRWLFYLLASSGLDTVSRDSAIPGLNRDDAYRMACPYPPPEEQAAIVRYLDHADELISRYIGAKERLIALLEEQRQAVIHQAVTRGLDPNVQLKPSAIPWIGDVPAHWKISRTKNEFQSLNHRRVPLSSTERGSMTLRRYDYYGASGVIDKVDSYLFDDELLLIAEDGANLVLRNSPLAIIARGQFWVNNHAHILKPRRGNLDFLAAVMQGINYTPWISGAAQPKLTSDRLMGISIAVPSRSEQDDIMEQTKKLTSPITSSIKRTQRQLTLMEEYRTRLIADVVTGQIDVRDAAVELPV